MVNLDKLYMHLDKNEALRELYSSKFGALRELYYIALEMPCQVGRSE